MTLSRKPYAVPSMLACHWNISWMCVPVHKMGMWLHAIIVRCCLQDISVTASNTSTLIMKRLKHRWGILQFTFIIGCDSLAKCHQHKRLYHQLFLGCPCLCLNPVNEPYASTTESWVPSEVPALPPLPRWLLHGLLGGQSALPLMC